MRWTVAVPTPEAFDKSSCRQPKRARAARICADSSIRKSFSDSAPLDKPQRLIDNRSAIHVYDRTVIDNMERSFVMSEISTAPRNVLTVNSERRAFIGGSDARTIMGDDEGALLRLWREKRGEVESEDLSGNLVVQLGVVTEPLNRHWFERNTGQVLTDVQRRVQHPVVRWMAATLD